MHITSKESSKSSVCLKSIEGECWNAVNIIACLCRLHTAIWTAGNFGFNKSELKRHHQILFQIRPGRITSEGEDGGADHHGQRRRAWKPKVDVIFVYTSTHKPKLKIKYRPELWPSDWFTNKKVKGKQSIRCASMVRNWPYCDSFSDYHWLQNYKPQQT
jgi:hypothetical protein